MATKPCKKLWRRDPRLCSFHMLRSTFVGDRELLDRLVGQYQESTLSRGRHYNLAVGAPGIGKSHLLAMVAHRVRVDVPDLLVAWLPEQPDGLAGEVHFFRAILRALGVELEDPEAGADRDEVTVIARRQIGEVVGDRTLLLIIENLDELFSSVGDLGQRTIRGFLQEERFCNVLASTRRLTTDFVDQERPFFGFFSVHRLREMTLRETVDFVSRLERQRGDRDTAEWFRGAACKPVLAALHHMLGGWPGRYVSSFGHAPLDHPESLLLRGLDELSVRHFAHVAQLSWQQRLILDWLAKQNRAVPVKTVAAACIISEQTVSPQLRGLRQAGFVRATPVGRQTYYEIADPLVGIDSEYALALFAFLTEWFVDRDLAIAGRSTIAQRVREVLEDPAAGEPRRLLALPPLERKLIASEKRGGE